MTGVQTCALPISVLFNEVPDFPYRDNWFTKDILHELAHIRKSILDLTYDVQDIRDFLLITMSSIIRTVSNADDHCTRTVVRKRLKKEIYPSMALKKFVEALIMNTHRINEYSRDLSGNNFVDITENSDARFIDFPDNNFDLAITSPPYVNAVDYTRTHQLEIYWLGLAKGSLTPLKQVHVGTEVVKVNDYNNLFNIGDKEADKVIEEIFLKDKRRAYIAYKYLYDMKLNLIEVYRTLKPGARYIIVVGNNKIKGYLFENWKYLMNIASQIGYKIENYFASEIIKHFIKVPREERINTDWIIVLRK